MTNPSETLQKLLDREESYAEMIERKEREIDSFRVELRDQFAMAALQGIVVNVQQDTPEGAVIIAENCYMYADAMLEARKK